MTRSRAETVAKAYHEAFERLAFDHDVVPREITWRQVPEAERKLMTAVVHDLLAREVIRTVPQVGPIEAATTKACKGRTDQPLVHVALMIARDLDRGVEDKALAGVARELRLTLDNLGVAVGTPEEKSVRDELREKRAARQAAAETQ